MRVQAGKRKRKGKWVGGMGIAERENAKKKG